jgi:hypothetical protein
MSIISDLKKKIEVALERVGVAWQLASKEEPRQRSGQLTMMATELRRFILRYRKKFPQDDPPDPFVLAEENPAKAAVFFHPETQILSEEMRVVAWRLLLGDEIESVTYKYRIGEPQELLIKLAGSAEPFISLYWFDFYALRRFRATEHNGQPVLQGYYLDDLTGQTNP